MKVFLKRPEHEARLYKPSRDEFAYEVWVVKPVMIGGCRRVGRARVRTDDGHEFPNTYEAMVHILESANEPALAEEVRLREQGEPATKIDGRVIAAQGMWKEFAQARKLDPKNMDAMNQQYELTPAELERFGLAGD